MISYITDSYNKPSTGWINGFANEAGILTADLRKQWFERMEYDATTVLINGKLQNVYTCVSGQYVFISFANIKVMKALKKFR